MLRQQQEKCRRRRRKGREAAKDLIGFVRSCSFGALNRGLQNLDSFFGKVLILLVRGRCLGVLIRGLGNLELPERERFYSFRLYEKNGEYPRGLRTSGLRGAIQSSVEEDFSRAFRRHEPNPAFRTKRRRKALNRCDTPVLQRKELERTEKEQRYSLVDSRLWLGANGRWRVEKGFSEWAIRKGLSKWIAFGLRKRATFRLMQNQPIKKSFF